MLNHRIINHRNIYFGGLALLGISLPLSMFGMSVALIALSVNWILEGHFHRKWVQLRARKGILFFMGVYLVHVLWLARSADLAYGFHDLKIKLPLLALPVIVGTSQTLSRREFRVILDLFVLAVIAGSLISTGVLVGIGNREITNIREISILISHIRFALMIVLALFIWGYASLYDSGTDSRLVKTLKIAGTFWLVCFLFILKSFTGLIIFVLIGTGTGIAVIFRTTGFMLRYFLSIMLITVLLLGALFSVRFYRKFSFRGPVLITGLETRTMNGNPYLHLINNREVENTHYVWLYVCEEELEPEWNSRSTLDYRGTDLEGQELRMTLLRYLTSKGLRKDSLGLASLTDAEIQWIEKGIANVIFTEGYTLYGMFYEMAWQIRMYRLDGNPTGHSITQRLEYLKAGWQIFNNNFWFGVGTGDVPDAFSKQYEVMESRLSEEWRLRTHNQFLTFGISFGIIGFVLVMASFLFPVNFEPGRSGYYFLVFLGITLLSMLAEDTLETSAGAMFAGYFYSLFLFGMNQDHR